MKKTLIISALAVLACLSSYGQGTVNFANDANTRVFLPGGTTPVPVGTQYSVELVYAPDGASIDTATRLGSTTGFFVAGRFSGGGRTAPTVPSGGIGLFQVRVFETAAGVDYNTAVASGNSAYLVGTSAVLRVDTSDPTTTPPQTAASLVAAGLASFTLSPIPEPSVIGLGLLGAGALLMLRRRK